MVLASHFINAPDQEVRRTLLRVCRRHVRDGGCVVLERHGPEWFDTAAPSERDLDAFLTEDRTWIRAVPRP